MGIEKIQAGNQYDYELDLPEYAGYVVTKAFNNIGSVFTITATESGNGKFTFSENSQATAVWVPGEYHTCVYATLGDARHTVEQSKARVMPDLAGAPTDNRGHVKKTLDALEAMIEGKATKDQASMTIAGRSLARYEPGDLLKWRDRYRAELQQINRMAGIAETTGNIYIRF